MESGHLIDAIVGELATLLAELAPEAGVRAPLAYVGDVLFSQLDRALRVRGVDAQGAAALFGMGRRSYERRLRRLRASESEPGSSLWQSVANYVISEGRARRADVLRRFRADDIRDVTAVLIDLVKSGTIRAHGREDASVYEGVEQGRDDERDTLTLLAEQIWGSVDRVPGTREEVLARFFRIRDAERVLDDLVADGRLTIVDEVLLATEDTPASGAKHGYEPAVLSHVRAMTQSITAKLRSTRDEPFRGTTVAFEIHDDHPNKEEVLALVDSVQSSIRELWDRVHAYNFAHPTNATTKVYFYVAEVIEPVEPVAESEDEP